MNDMTPVQTTLKDWETDQEVRWCPGCGDYAILKAVQRTLPQIGADPANTVFISGIGCSSRFPYYMESYGFHTIHGRAPAVATGVMCSTAMRQASIAQSNASPGLRAAMTGIGASPLRP